MDLLLKHGCKEEYFFFFFDWWWPKTQCLRDWLLHVFHTLKSINQSKQMPSPYIENSLVCLKYPDEMVAIDVPQSCKRAEKLADSTQEKVLKVLIEGWEMARHDFDYEREKWSLDVTKVLRIAKILDLYNCPNLIQALINLQKWRKGRVREYLKKNGIKV